VPNTGCFAVSDAHDTIGPLARTVAEVADTHEVMRLAMADMRALGAKVTEITLPDAELAQQHLLAVVQADAAALHVDRLASAPATFGADVLDRLRHGQALTGRAYADAMRFKQRWLRTLDQAFAEVDVLLMPTCPSTAPLCSDAAKMLETTRKVTRFTYAWSMAGTPALSVPCGLADNGLPVAIQLIAPRWHDARVLALGAHYQQATAHHLRRPPLVEEALARLGAQAGR